MNKDVFDKEVLDKEVLDKEIQFVSLERATTYIACLFDK
jgi:hypothetical protein